MTLCGYRSHEYHPRLCCSAMNLDMAQDTSPSPNNTMAPYDWADNPDQCGPGGSTAFKHQYGYRLWPRPQVYMWPLVPWAIDINTDPDFGRAINLTSSSVAAHTVTPGGSIGHSDWHGPHGTKALGHQHSPIGGPDPFNDVRSYGHRSRS